mgnify:CR=1
KSLWLKKIFFNLGVSRPPGPPQFTRFADTGMGRSANSNINVIAHRRWLQIGRRRPFFLFDVNVIVVLQRRRRRQR